MAVCSISELRCDAGLGWGSKRNARHGVGPFAQGRQVEQPGALDHYGRRCEAEHRSLAGVRLDAVLGALRAIGGLRTDFPRFAI